MDKNYVSEFTVFMNKYLKENPDVVEDQRRGRDIHWNPKIAEQERLNLPGTDSRSKQ
jgi:hypothetical protein